MQIEEFEVGDGLAEVDLLPGGGGNERGRDALEVDTLAAFCAFSASLFLLLLLPYTSPELICGTL